MLISCLRLYIRQCIVYVFLFFQAEDGIRDLVRSRGLGDVYKRQSMADTNEIIDEALVRFERVFKNVEGV